MGKSSIVIAIAGTVAPMLMMGSASAASLHTISGTVYEGGAWYKSSTVRTVASSNTTIQIALNSAPSKGIQWRLINAKNGQVFTKTISLGSHGGTATLATQVLAKTLFQNDYRQNSSCDFNCGSYNFSGSESY
jgi:hypothetical protein